MATTVAPLSILPSEELLALFAYVANTDKKDAKVHKGAATSGPKCGPYLATPRKGVNFRVFTYESDFDTNGLMYYLGTDGGNREWVNPMQASPSLVTVTCNHNMESGSLWNILGRTASSGYVSPPSASGNWFMIDLGDRVIQPTYYTLRHGHATSFALRNWRFEGSNDNEKWDVLRQHTADTGLIDNSSYRSFSWPLTATQAYRYFRIHGTGMDSSGSYQYLMLMGVEIYGESYTKN